jgi:hypothetical protein
MNYPPHYYLLSKKLQEEIRAHIAAHRAIILARREQRKLETIARNEAKRIAAGKKLSISREIRQKMRDERVKAEAESRRLKLEQREIRKQARVEQRKVYQKNRSKTGWTRKELDEYLVATRNVLKVGKKHLFEKPKIYRTSNGCQFDTAEELAEYQRGWIEHRQWCADNSVAIKEAAVKRNVYRKRIDRMLKAGFFTLEAYDNWLATRPHPSSKPEEHHQERRRIRNQWRNYRKQLKAGMGANGGRIPKGWMKSQHDAQDGRCALCLEPLDEKFEIDHIIPVHLGGPNEAWNLQLTHAKCNATKNGKFVPKGQFAVK